MEFDVHQLPVVSCQLSVGPHKTGNWRLATALSHTFLLQTSFHLACLALSDIL
jgi:hypothetical protein